MGRVVHHQLRVGYGEWRRMVARCDSFAKPEYGLTHPEHELTHEMAKVTCPRCLEAVAVRAENALAARGGPP